MDVILKDISAENAAVGDPANKDYAPHDDKTPYIYRRFLKAAIVIVLSLGGSWGVISLMQVSSGQALLQPQLLPAINAHAHAMIFGWVGLFVMGFTYQFFPHFKKTPLWKPPLANSTLYLMIAGILARIGGDMLQHGDLALSLGAVSAATEITAVILFMIIIFKTARQSISPRSPYELFIFMALDWFLIQTIFSSYFFFAKATAANMQQIIMNTALFDAPLRDIQLLGFAAFFIAGISQQLLPVAYDVGQPRHGLQGLIFWLMNGSLLLDVVSFVALLTTGDPKFAVTLEISYILMALWAVLLVIQLRIFTRTRRPDRSWKFIRAAYVWLLIAMTMMPLLMPYSSWMGEGFSHAFSGAHLHAFTVGFISMMILGVSSRTVPILVGLDVGKLTSLWGPFILLNVGCAGRVVLEILTDSRPNLAYHLIGITGFLELGALAWWGVELWQVMNLSETHQTDGLEVHV